MKHQQSKKTIRGGDPYNTIINSKFANTLKSWFKKASAFTREEGKVLSIRALEAGKLTTLNAKRYQLKRQYESICAEIGQQVLGLSILKKESGIASSPKIQELIGKASQIEREMKLVSDEIDSCKKDCDTKVGDVHRNKAA